MKLKSNSLDDKGLSSGNSTPAVMYKGKGSADELIKIHDYSGWIAKNYGTQLTTTVVEKKL